MKIAILGYGKMGQMIEKILNQRNHQISAIIDNETDWEQKIQAFKTSDAAIDFSQPDAAVPNIMRAFGNAVPIVVGTTGWHNNLEEVKNACSKYNGRLLYSANFSIGVNVFFRLNQYLTALLSENQDYKVSLEEIHHVHKKDAPSGTAIRLANDIIDNSSNYNNWKLTPCELLQNTISVTAIRKDEVPGTHKVVWKSDVDEIEIKHTAHNREGFALGAVIAAEWLAKKSIGIYTFDQCLSL